MEWRIPLFDVDLGNEEIEAVTNVLKSKWLTMGEITQEFERRFAEYLGIRYGLAVSNATAALHLAYQVLGIGKGDEVICPSFTFVATANSILYTGALPVFADINSFDNFNISPDSILTKITPKTRAITVVHYGGYPCDMGRIMQIAKEYNLYVIEDAAHAPGAEYKGRKCGTIGDIGCFSFFSNKNMTTGEGGMVTTNNDEFAEKIKSLRSHGLTTLTLDRHKGHAYSYDVVNLGYNYRIDEIRAAIGLVQLKKLTRNNALRRQIVKTYINRFKNIPEISIPFKESIEVSSCHIFPTILQKGKKREVFMKKLKDQRIQTSIHYPPMHLFKYYQDRFKYKEGMLPITEQVGKQEVTLPLYPMMKDEDIDYIVEKIKKILQEV